MVKKNLWVFSPAIVTLMLLTMMSYAKANVEHVVMIDKDGNYNVHNRYYKGGKETISKFPNWEKTAQLRYQLEKNAFRGTGTINAPVVSATNGAKSAGTVMATVTDSKGKRQVMQEVLDKARKGGKALGKGAVTVGSAAMRRTVYGIAFSLALDALTNSKFFWDDEKGDFVREDNDNMYIVLSTQHASSYFPPKLDDKSFYELCANNRCQKVAIIEGKVAAQKAAENFCKSRTYQSSGNTYNYDSIGWSGYCYDSKNNTLSGTGVKVARWIDYVPMTLDEFIDEGTPEAAQKPDEWVKTAEVPSNEKPKTEVPAGSVAQSDPYTDPRDGKRKQTRWDFEPNGKVKEREIERPDLPPNSPEAPELKPPVIEEPPPEPNEPEKEKEKDGESEKEKEKSDTEDLCEKHPDILACDKQPEEPKEQEFEIPHEEVNLFFTPDTIFPTTGRCPAPVSFTVDIPFSGTKTFEFDTMPVCEIARRLRNLLISIAWLVTAVFCFRSFSLSKD